MSNIILNLGKSTIGSSDTISDLRRVGSFALQHGANWVVDGTSAVGDGGGGVFVWNGTSVADDNGTTVVLPNDRLTALGGRWILLGSKNIPIDDDGDDGDEEAPPFPQFLIPNTAEVLGVTADTSPFVNFIAFEELFGEPVRGVIQLDAREYQVSGKGTNGDGVLYFRQSNCTVRGVLGRTKITTSTMQVLMHITGDATIRNVVFEDIIFEVLDPRGSIYGAVTAFGCSIYNMKFHRCTFRYPNGAGNGSKFVAEGGIRHESIHHYECVFEDIGRIGYEPQNTEIGVGGDNQLVRMWDHKVVDCTFRNIGQQSLSFEGYGSDFAVTGCTFDNANYIGIENVGWSNGVIDDISTRNMTRPCDLLSFTNFRPMRDNTISNIKTNGQINGSLVIRNQVRLRMMNNHIDIKGLIGFLGISESKIENDHYKVGRWPGINIDATAVEPCSNNQFDGVTLELTGAVKDGFAPIVINSSEQANRSTNNHFDRIRYIDAEGVSDTSIYKLATVGFMGENSIRMFGSRPLVFNIPADADTPELNSWYAAIRGAGALILTSAVALTVTRAFPIRANTLDPVRIRNDTQGAQAIEIYVPGQTSRVTIPNGESRLVYSTDTEVKVF